MTFGEKVAVLRKNKGLTQEELGAQLRLSEQSIQKWERGIEIPEISVVLSLSKLLGVSVDLLIDDDKELVLVASKREDPTPAVQRRRLTYGQLRNRKVIPLSILLPVTIATYVFAFLLLFLENTTYALISLILFLASPVLLVFTVILITINIKRYTFNDHEIAVYAGASKHYLVVDGYVHDFYESIGFLKDKYLKATVDGKEVVATLTWSNSISLKIDGNAVFPGRRR